MGKAKRDRDGEKEGGLTWDEESAIVSYKSGDSGKFSPDDPINLGGYLSVSMDPNTDRTSGQYTVDMVIDAKTARSINGFGANTEREAILPRGVDLVPRSMERVGPYKFKITVEKGTNGSGKLAAERVQHLREGEQGREDLRGISGRYPVGVPAENQGTAGREGYNAGLSGVSAGNRSAALDDAGMAADHAGTGAGSGAGPRTREVNDGLGGAVLRRIIFMGRRSPGSGRSSESSDGGIFCG